MEAPSKRRREDPASTSTSISGSEIDIEATPRQPKSFRPSLPARTSSQRSNVSSSRLSPKKQLVDRQNKPWPILVRQYGPDEAGLPSSLRQLWKDLARYSRGTKVIAKSAEEEITAAKATSPHLDTIEPWYYDDTATRDELGPSPPVTQVLSLLADAKVCSNEGFCEASWNMTVHREVLKLAMRQYTPTSDEEVFFIPCPTAKIMDAYTDTRGPSRKVDFCMLIEPQGLAADAIRAIQYQDQLFSQSLNHTDYQPLRRRPVALSIETKAPGEGINDAQSQLLVWLEAQWRVLERLSNRAEPPLPLPEFLPGVIVEGHQWYFVASTRSKTETILWMKQLIGTTEEAIGIYSVVCTLQYLAHWIRAVYWPAFQRLLSLPPLT
ncbi:hypothetical protein ColLi_13293 [Colletotrichum liriopes]|uniref:PD-(D/E)XK nuclease-like domain-containing protein n=1 Tax=Colletotrichum liriopes TaxID=708192 RepID=A0AA37GZY5_9PEZI|nr:hypothetical protein ColLi_13293 [Colletotrichum liriopes]